MKHARIGMRRAAELVEMKERIGEFLVRIGVMYEYQVKDVLNVQAQGDRRLFGEIALNLGYIKNEMLTKCVELRRSWGYQ